MIEKEEIEELLGKRIELIVRNAHSKLRRRYRGQSLWAFVADITGFGSTYSIEVCIMWGWDPGQDAGFPI